MFDNQCYVSHNNRPTIVWYFLYNDYPNIYKITKYVSTKINIVFSGTNILSIKK